MRKLKALFKQVSGPNSAFALLTVAAVGATVLTVLASTLVYKTTRQLISSAEWVQHTEDVLASLQRVSLLDERIEYRTRLYVLTDNEEQLNRAKASANQLETTVARLKVLVADNSSEATNMQSLTSCSGELMRVVEGFTQKSAEPDLALKRCQLVIGLMVDQEQWLLKDRAKHSELSSVTSIETEIGFGVLSLISMVVLFSFLMRDAMTRQRTGKQVALSNERLARTVNALEDRAQESELLTSARDELQLCVEVSQVYKSSAHSIARLLPGSSGSVCIINNSRQLVEVVSSWTSGEDASPVDDFHTPDSCCGLRSGQPRWREPNGSKIDCTHFAGPAPERYLCIPIVAHGNTLGVINVRCNTDRILLTVKDHMDGLRQLVQLTGMAAATLNLRTKLENQSIRDSLTGLFNRHFMQISLERELARASRRKQTLAVFMLDLDHFKRFNDTHGHGAGDAVLQGISEIFRNSIRTEDIACRYGGEEFTIILPDVTTRVAFDRAESIRRAVENLQLPLDNDVHGEFTVSIGIALFPEDGETAELLLRRADQSLYRAKRSGRNKVIQYEADSAVSQAMA
jgi:diguanylate cyclase (GGDEF)-like protein